MKNGKFYWLPFSLFCFAALMFDTGALANDEATEAVVYPAGSSFGMIPFEGLSEAEDFSGFVDLSDGTSVTINAMPLADWDETSNGFQDKALWAAQGIVAKHIEQTLVDGMHAVRISGSQFLQGRQIPKCVLLVRGKYQIGIYAAQIPDENYSGADACSLIRGISERPTLSVESQLEALPFELPELGGLRVVRVLGGSGVLLTHGPLDVVKSVEQPVMIVTTSLAPTSKGWARTEFSEQLLRSIPQFTVENITHTLKVSVKGQPAIEIVADIRHLEAGLDARIIQWIAFAPDGNYSRMIGISRPEHWDDSRARFERVMSGFGLRPSQTKQTEQ